MVQAKKEMVAKVGLAVTGLLLTQILIACQDNTRNRGLLNSQAYYGYGTSGTRPTTPLRDGRDAEVARGRRSDPYAVDLRGRRDAGDGRRGGLEVDPATGRVRRTGATPEGDRRGAGTGDRTDGTGDRTTPPEPSIELVNESQPLWVRKCDAPEAKEGIEALVMASPEYLGGYTKGNFHGAYTSDRSPIFFEGASTIDSNTTYSDDVKKAKKATLLSTLKSEQGIDGDGIPFFCEQYLSQNGFPALDPEVFNGYKVSVAILSQDRNLPRNNPRAVTPTAVAQTPKPRFGWGDITAFFRDVWNYSSENYQTDRTSRQERISKLNQGMADLIVKLRTQFPDKSSINVLDSIYRHAPHFAMMKSTSCPRDVNTSDLVGSVSCVKGGYGEALIFKPMKSISKFDVATMTGVGANTFSRSTRHSFLYLVQAYVKVKSSMKIVLARNVGADGQGERDVSGIFMGFVDGDMPVNSIDFDYVKRTNERALNGIDTSLEGSIESGGANGGYRHLVVGLVSQEEFDPIEAQKIVRENLYAEIDGKLEVLPQEIAVADAPSNFVMNTTNNDLDVLAKLAENAKPYYEDAATAGTNPAGASGAKPAPKTPDTDEER